MDWIFDDCLNEVYGWIDDLACIKNVGISFLVSFFEYAVFFFWRKYLYTHTLTWL